MDIDIINAYCTIIGIDPEDFIHSEKQLTSNWQIFGITILMFWDEHNPPHFMQSMLSLKFG